MDEPLHHIDDLFFHELEGYQEAPSPRVWDEVNAELGTPAAPAAAPARVQSLWVLKAAMVLLLMVSGYALNRHQHEKIGSVRTDPRLPATPDANGQNRISAGTVSETAKMNGQHDTGDPANIAIQVQPELPAHPVTPGYSGPASVTHRSAAPAQRSAQKKNDPGADAARDMAATKGQAPKATAASGHNNDQEFQRSSADEQITRKGSVKNMPHETGRITGSEVATIVASPRNSIPVTTSSVPLLDREMPNTLIGRIGDQDPFPGLQSVSFRPAPGTIHVKTPHRISLVASFAPDLTWTKMEDHEVRRPGGWGGGPHEDHHDISENERAGFSYSAGARMQLETGRHFFLGTGLSYASMQTKQEPKKLYADKDEKGDVRFRMNCSAGYSYLLPESGTAPAVGDSILMNQSNYNVQYLRIPLYAGYAFGHGRFTASVIGGAQFNVLLKGRTTAVLQQGTSSKTTVATPVQGLKKLTTDLVAGISLDYRIAPQFSLNLTPVSRYSLSPINQSGNVTSRTGAVSLAAGLRYFF